MGTADEEVDPMGALSAFVRISYSDLVTVITTSLLTTLAALPVVTIGAGILALVDTLTTIITAEGRGEAPHTERARLRYYVASFRRNLRRGIPYSLVLVSVGLATASYVAIAFSTGSTPFLVGGVVGLYAVVLTTMWVFRAASVTVRSPEHPGFKTAMSEAWYHLLEELSYTALQAIGIATLVLATGFLRIAVPLLLAGLVGVLEVVSYEEVSGEGATTLYYGYRGEASG